MRLGLLAAEPLAGTAGTGLVNFFAGSFVLAGCGAVFLPVYLAAANFFGLVEPDEKLAIRKIFRKMMFMRGPGAVAEI